MILYKILTSFLEKTELLFGAKDPTMKGSSEATEKESSQRPDPSSNKSAESLKPVSEPGPGSPEAQPIELSSRHRIYRTWYGYQ